VNRQIDDDSIIEIEIIFERISQAKGKRESKAAYRWTASSCAVTITRDTKSHVAE